VFEALAGGGFLGICPWFGAGGGVDRCSGGFPWTIPPGRTKGIPGEISKSQSSLDTGLVNFEVLHQTWIVLCLARFRGGGVLQIATPEVAVWIDRREDFFGGRSLSPDPRQLCLALRQGR